MHALLNRMSASMAENLTVFSRNLFSPTKAKLVCLSLALRRKISVCSEEEEAGELRFMSRKNKTPVCVSRQGFRNSILTMTYSHMGKPHTTIGDASFHC